MAIAKIVNPICAHNHSVTTKNTHQPIVAKTSATEIIFARNGIALCSLKFRI